MTRTITFQDAGFGLVFPQGKTKIGILFCVMLTRSSTLFVGPLPPYPATLSFLRHGFSQGGATPLPSLEILLEGRANEKLPTR